MYFRHNNTFAFLFCNYIVKSNLLNFRCSIMWICFAFLSNICNYASLNSFKFVGCSLTFGKYNKINTIIFSADINIRSYFVILFVIIRVVKLRG
jgi:hypothetical protein